MKVVKKKIISSSGNFWSIEKRDFMDRKEKLQKLKEKKPNKFIYIYIIV